MHFYSLCAREEEVAQCRYRTWVRGISSNSGRKPSTSCPKLNADRKPGLPLKEINSIRARFNSGDLVCPSFWCFESAFPPPSHRLSVRRIRRLTLPSEKGLPLEFAKTGPATGFPGFSERSRRISSRSASWRMTGTGARPLRVLGSKARATYILEAFRCSRTAAIVSEGLITRVALAIAERERRQECRPLRW